MYGRAIDDFGEFVNFLETSPNDLAYGASNSQKNRMRSQFHWTVRNEVSFRDMAYGRSGDQWVKTE